MVRSPVATRVRVKAPEGSTPSPSAKDELLEAWLNTEYDKVLNEELEKDNWAVDAYNYFAKIIDDWEKEDERKERRSVSTVEGHSELQFVRTPTWASHILPQEKRISIREMPRVERVPARKATRSILKGTPRQGDC